MGILSRLGSLSRDWEGVAILPPASVWTRLLEGWRPRGGAWAGAPVLDSLDEEEGGECGARGEVEYGLRLLATFPHVIPHAGALLAPAMALAYSLRTGIPHSLAAALTALPLHSDSVGAVVRDWLSLPEPLVEAAVMEASLRWSTHLSTLSLDDALLSTLSPRLQVLFGRLSGVRRKIRVPEGWEGGEWEAVCEWSLGPDREDPSRPIANWITATAHNPAQQDYLLFCCDLSKASRHRVLLNLGLMQLMIDLVPDLERLPSDHKDFLLCSLLTWLQSCAETDMSAGSERLEVRLFFHRTSLLYTAVHNRIASAQQGLREEWEGFFLDGCAASIAPIFFRLLSAPRTWTRVRESWSLATRSLNGAHLETLALPTLLDPVMDDAKYPAKFQSRLIPLRSCFQLQEPNTVLAASHLISLYIYLLRSIEMVEMELGEGTEAGRQEGRLPEWLDALANDTFSALEAATLARHADFHDGPPGLTTVKLLKELTPFFGAASALINFLSAVPPERRMDYSGALAKSACLDNLIHVLLGLLPQRPRRVVSGFDWGGVEGRSAEEEMELVDFERVPDSDLPAYFLSRSILPSTIPGSGQASEVALVLEEWGGRLLSRLLLHFPSALRSWLNAQGKATAAALSSYVEVNLSPLLVRAELDAIAAAGGKFGDMTLSVRRETKEVLAVYAVEELRMELLGRLPRCYPIQKPVFEEGARLRVRKEQWRKWMLQLNLLLEGSVLEGLLKWKRNVDEHLAGVEDCPICMMTVHVTTNQLPKLVCRQCKNKFHAACLYKWFESSNNTTCPLCRKPFSAH